MMRKKKALIVWGGWEGHEPEQVAGILGDILKEENFEVEITPSLDVFKDAEKMSALNLIVPVVTQETIEKEQLDGLLEAVKVHAVGIAGCHGGMADSFRNETEYQYMVGGQWVAHPGNDGVTYRVNIVDRGHPLTQDMEDFTVVSEQYYMHVDPGVKVHATTNFGDVKMPVVWTKTYGLGRVYYNSLGHVADIVRMPEVTKLMRLGMVWAAK